MLITSSSSSSPSSPVHPPNSLSSAHPPFFSYPLSVAPPSPTTPLFMQCAVELLNNNADIHKTNSNGGNALYFACRYENHLF